MSTITEKELSILFPNKETKIQEDTKVTIRPFTWKECYTVVKYITPTIAKLLNTNAISFDEKDGIQFNDPAVILDALMETQDAVTSIIKLSTGLDESTIDSLLPDSIFTILLGVFEVNSNFFVDSVLPIIVKAQGQASKLK
jgi:hypothetical protein